MKNKPKPEEFERLLKHLRRCYQQLCICRNYSHVTVPKAPQVQSKFSFCGCNFYNPHLSQATAAPKFVFLRESCYSEMNHRWISDTVLGTVVYSIFPW